jgi:hypothetical protein
MPYHFTEYFEREVLRKRPYLRREWCIRVIESPSGLNAKSTTGIVSGQLKAARSRRALSSITTPPESSSASISTTPVAKSSCSDWSSPGCRERTSDALANERCCKRAIYRLLRKPAQS